MKREVRFPSIFGIIILILGLIVGVVLTNRRALFSSKASGSCLPTSLQITNLTNSSADISFITESFCLVSLNLNSRSIPDFSPSLTHYYQVNGLSSNTEYEFSFIANGETFARPEYKFKTTPSPASPIPGSNLAWGRVYRPDLSPAAGSIVYLLIPGATPLSALVTSSGNWNISLASSIKDDGSDWFTPSSGQSEDIIVISPEGMTTQIATDTSQNTPVPDIILGQNSFAASPVFPIDGAALESTQPGIVVKSLTINNPDEGELLNTLKPQFIGVAPANSSLTIKVESPIVANGTAISGRDGLWSWSPPNDLSPGQHTVTVTTTNPETGMVDTIVRKFVVLAADNQLAFTSSPSASIITPTITPSPISTLTPTPTPSPADDEVIIAGATATPPVPVTGNAQPLLFLAMFAVILIISSALICCYPNRY